MKFRFNLTKSKRIHLFDSFVLIIWSTYQHNHYYRYPVDSLIREDGLQFGLEKGMDVYF